MRVIEVYNGDTPTENLSGCVYTGEIMKIGYDSGRGKDEIIRTFHVLRGKRTPKFEVRDCGDHYIKANYRTFDCIDKKTLEIVRDVKDE